MEQVIRDQVEEKLDCQGFFTDTTFWSEDVAEHLARANEIGEFKLTADHWKVINYVKAYYEEHKEGPAMVKVVKNTGLKMGQICALFPCGLVKGAYRLAGLPKPPGCV